MKRFKDVSLRAQWWDYSKASTYFITINTKDRKKFFGKIENKEMILSPIGEKVKEEWQKAVIIRPDMNIELHDFVIMPEHFHALISIGKNPYNGKDTILTGNNEIKCNSFKPQSNNLSSVIRGFKSSVTQYCRLNNLDFNWQTRYHDIIVKDPFQFVRIQKYIQDNPKNY